MNLFCRITCSYVTFTPVVQLIETKCDKLVIYEHNANINNIHIHLYIEECTVSTDTLKNYCKRFGITGGIRGSGWSFKTATDTGCITYMSKGNLEPSFIKGFTQEEIVSYRDSWVERTRETAPKKDTHTQYSMAMEVYQIVKDKLSNSFGEHHTQEIYRLCFIEAINVHHKYGKGFDEFTIKRVVHPAYVKFEHCHTQFVNKAVDKFFS